MEVDGEAGKERQRKPALNIVPIQQGRQVENSHIYRLGKGAGGALRWSEDHTWSSPNVLPDLGRAVLGLLTVSAIGLNSIHTPVLSTSSWPGSSHCQVHLPCPHR